jgi:hypothetical protein
MTTREDLKEWVIEALNAHRGRATVFEVCKYIWTRHERELRTSERLLYN